MTEAARIFRTVAILFVVLMAPKGMLARVRGLDIEELWRLAGNLEWMRKRGRRLRYPGENLVTVAARLELVVWIARTPAKALRHLSLQLRGWKRARSGTAAPPSFGAVRFWLPAPVFAAPAPAIADSS